MKAKRNAFWADLRISSVFRLYCLRLVQFNGKTISVAVLWPEQYLNISGHFTLQRRKQATHRNFLQRTGHGSIFKYLNTKQNINYLLQDEYAVSFPNQK